MRSVNIQIHAVFETMEQKYHKTQDPNWRWCMAVGCGEGQIYATNDGNVCTCWKCGARVCVACDKPYHEGEVCEEYRLRTEDQLDEEKLALDVIESTTQKCPACKAPMEKRGGCNSMHSKWNEFSGIDGECANKCRSLRNVLWVARALLRLSVPPFRRSTKPCRVAKMLASVSLNF
jgi:hypothetical protein